MHSATRTAATVVIATRNRCEEVLRAVQSALEQSYRPLEVLVYDDASTDGTLEAVRRQFPEVRAVRSEQHVGYIVLRNRGFRDAAGDIIFSIDDDAYFTGADTVARTVALFAKNPRAAAVALPYVEPSADASRLMPEVVANRRLRGFVGCACALRRDIAISLGGYRDFFVHQGEERDLAIRLRERGYEIVFGDTDPIVHMYSPKRDRSVMAYLGVRNTLLFDVLNVPLPYVVPRLAADAFNLFRYRLTCRSAPTRLGYVLSGMLSCATYWRLRKPVRRETYRLYRELPTHGPLPLERKANHSTVRGDIATTGNTR